MSNSQKISLNLLDFHRDGGYYNNWDFSEKLIKYLVNLSRIRIKYVEIGLEILNKIVLSQDLW